MTVTTSTSVFKNIVVASTLEEATINLLVKWFPTYIRQLEYVLELEIGKIPPPVYYSNRNSFDLNPGEKFPKCIVISDGLADAPTRKGDGYYRASWRLGVGIAAVGPDESYVNMLTKIYGAAARAIVEQNKISDEVVESHWVTETYDDLAITAQNQLCKGASVYFTVDCDNVLNKWAGPETPDDEPYAYGIAEKVIIDLVKVPTDEEVVP